MKLFAHAQLVQMDDADTVPVFSTRRQARALLETRFHTVFGQRAIHHLRHVARNADRSHPCRTLLTDADMIAASP
jgi:hypothetical protein